MEKKIYVANISNATEQDIRDIFSDYGEVISVKIKSSKGFGFVEMADAHEANEAISELNGRIFLGKPLSVSEATPRHPRADFHGKTGGFGKNKNFKKAW